MMTKSELEDRVATLEKQVARLQQQVESMAGKEGHPNPHGPWWREGAGRFAGDPVFEEIVRLGRAYRESTRPGRVKKMKRRTAKKNAGS